MMTASSNGHSNPRGDHVVIIGAGQAGGAVAAGLRQQGYSGAITLLGDEAEAPYQRPPLSKAFLKGDTDVEALKLRPESFYLDRDIDFQPVTQVEAIDLTARRVRITGRPSVAWTRLVLATGARARTLRAPGADLDGVISLRTLADAEALKRRLQPGARLVILGGGYVGLEIAASARALGVEVLVLERESRCMARVACGPLSTFMEKIHRERGVVIETGVSAVGFQGDHGVITGVRLNDGRLVPCDVCVVGVGAEPNDELARASGIVVASGVVVDDRGRTSATGVYAAGDVTWRPLGPERRMVRIESVPNALEQAKQIVADILDLPAPAPEVPWFWSDQYEFKIQIAGIPHDPDRQIVRWITDGAAFAVFHLKGGDVVGAEAVNAPREFMFAKQVLANGWRIDADRLADPDVALKELVLEKAVEVT
ncbi:FAD-dependent oxidoreductase [soil metagenome]